MFLLLNSSLHLIASQISSFYLQPKGNSYSMFWSLLEHLFHLLRSYEIGVCYNLKAKIFFFLFSRWLETFALTYLSIKRFTPVFRDLNTQPYTGECSATTLHKKWNFQLRISSVNLTKSAVSCGFGHIYWRNPPLKTSFFVQC